METRKCCYMERACTPACVAYNNSEELNRGVEEMGLNDMHCTRMFLEFAEVFYNNSPFDFSELEEEEEF